MNILIPNNYLCKTTAPLSDLINSFIDDYPLGNIRERIKTLEIIAIDDSDTPSNNYDIKFRMGKELDSGEEDEQ